MRKLIIPLLIVLSLNSCMTSQGISMAHQPSFSESKPALLLITAPWSDAAAGEILNKAQGVQWYDDSKTNVIDGEQKKVTIEITYNSITSANINRINELMKSINPEIKLEARNN